MRGGIFAADVPVSEARDRVAAEPSMVGRDLAREVTTPEPRVYDPTHPGGPRIVALDTGIKRSIIRNFTSRGATLEIHPCTTSAEDLLATDPDGFFLVPGPGDPAALGYIVDTIRILLADKPVFGICLGHQLLGLALGGTTSKLPFGHHGANHPVRRLSSGAVEITSQNHNYAVDPDSLGGAEVTHVNLNDGVVEGLRLARERAFSVQYHPEAAAGPHDAAYLFDRFTDLMSDGKDA
jgi:carbamoyl-phosphate synthase small subunit